MNKPFFIINNILAENDKSPQTQKRVFPWPMQHIIECLVRVLNLEVFLYPKLLSDAEDAKSQA